MTLRLHVVSVVADGNKKTGVVAIGVSLLH